MNRHRPDTHPQPPSPAAEPGSAGRPPASRTRGLHAWMMPLCLGLMGLAVVLLMWRGQGAGGAWLLLPMLLCLGMHFLMHRHGHHHRDE
ncbi:hypothetical protein [Billgrantia lactosivorans]|uniref:hypothetical protein n=1 Tax=Billgrantia lactosivorans TaxID=2185141 RepID=UPI0013A6B1B2|nr:hypothetical protein [Halomonas lactosivorans]